MKVAILGGTGPQGRGLALRLAKAGVHVTIGSREEARAVQSANELNALLEGRKGVARIEGADNATAVRASPRLVMLAVPYAAHDETLRALARADI